MLPGFWLFVLSIATMALSALSGEAGVVFALYLASGAALVWHLKAFPGIYVPPGVQTSPLGVALFWPFVALNRVRKWFHTRRDGYERFTSSGGTESGIETEFFSDWDDAVAYARRAALHTGQPGVVMDRTKVETTRMGWFGPVENIMYKVTAEDVRRT